MKEIFIPTMEGLKKEGRTFKGVIFFGLMLTENGPKVIEYNARFGDPETQVVLSRLESDLFDIMYAVSEGKLKDVDVSWSDNAAVCVVAASGGYPVKYSSGYEINGIDTAEAAGNIKVFHAGTKAEDGKFKTAGGRVLGVTAVSGDLDTAIKDAYAAIGKISFTDMHYRTDIGVK